MLALRLDDDLAKRVAALALRQGRNKSAVVREALIRYMNKNRRVAKSNPPVFKKVRTVLIMNAIRPAKQPTVQRK